MSDKKGSGLDIFDSLSKKKESAMPSDSGVVAKAQTSKAPPPPPSLSRPKASAPGAPMAPPSLAQLSAPVSRGSMTPPPPPSSLKPQTPPMALAPTAPALAPTPAPPPAFRPSAPPPPRPSVASSPAPRPSAPPPPSLRQPTPPPPTPRPSAPPPAPRLSAPTPPSAPPLSAPLPPPPGVPSALNSYSNDAEDDAPTRLYSPGSTPPPPQKTLPRNERPAPISRGAAPPQQSPQLPKPPPGKAALFPSSATSSADGKNRLYAVLAAAVVILAAGAVYWFGGRTGALTITVSGPGGRPVDGVEIFVDGAKQCESSPCRLTDLKPGAHLVRASAKGYQDTADQAISVESGQQGTHNISLVTAGAGTGVRVSALGSGLRLYVDGQEIGELPQTAKNLTPGEHTIRVAGSDRYEPWEERITLEDGEMKTEGPLKLRVKKGLATFKAGPGADGARVLLDGRLVPELPSTIEVPAGKQLTLVATKTGYSTYRRTVSFDDGIAEKSFEITMAEGSDESPAPSAPSGSDTVSASNVAHAPAPGHHLASAPPPPPPSREPAKGKAVINVNSIPVTNVILNGRPIGQTPKVGVQVTPGPQTVVFVHPDLGRKVMTGTVKAGETKTFMAKLP